MLYRGRMTEPPSPQRLNSAQRDENYQNCPNLTFKRPDTAFIGFKTMKDIRNQHIELHRKKLRGAKLRKKKLKRSYPTRYSILAVFTKDYFSETFRKFRNFPYFPKHSESVGNFRISVA